MIIGGVAASRDHINIVILIVVVVVCAIAGDSVGYLVGEKWGRRLLDVGSCVNARVLDRGASNS